MGNGPGPASDATGRQPLNPKWAEENDWRLDYSLAAVRYRGEVVDRKIVVSVDGGQAVLPAGSIEALPYRPDEPQLPGIVRVSRFHYTLARLIHAVTYGNAHGFDHYFEFTENIVDE